METTYRIYGEKIGKIWMPAAECRKEFDHILEKYPEDTQLTANSYGWPLQIHRLRDALLYITNDGDFQNCEIEWACLEVTRRKGRRSYTRTFELTGSDGNKDCFVA